MTSQPRILLMTLITLGAAERPLGIDPDGNQIFRRAGSGRATRSTNCLLLGGNQQPMCNENSLCFLRSAGLKAAGCAALRSSLDISAPVSCRALLLSSVTPTHCNMNFS